MIVTSATYRQDSKVSPELWNRDPENRWLARAPRLRLDAEMIRDSGLLASGQLAERVGGPSVFPPQLASITTEGAYGPLSWTVSDPPDRYRRSLYTFAKRTAPFAMFNTFDAPTGESCLARRDTSNTPLQALTLLNDPIFVEAARVFAARLLADPSAGDNAARIRLAYRLALNREPRDAELASLAGFLATQRDAFKAVPADAEKSVAVGLAPRPSLDPIEHAAWMQLARVLLNTQEVITRY